MASNPLASTIITEAVTWLGTPYKRQGSKRGKGASCLGFVGGVFVRIGAMKPIADRDYPPKFWEKGLDLIREGVEEGAANLRTGFEVTKPGLDEIQIGDVACVTHLRKGAIPTHAVLIEKFVGGSPSIIHSRFGGGGKVERTSLRCWRVLDCYRLLRTES